MREQIKPGAGGGGIGGHLTVEVGDPDERKQLQDLDEKVATVPRLQVLHEEPVDH